MTEHVIVATVPTPTDDRGAPEVAPVGDRGSKVECVTCHKQGFRAVRWPDSMHWLRAHVEHVECSCGAIVSLRGFNNHVASRRRHPLPAPSPEPRRLLRQSSRRIDWLLNEEMRLSIALRDVRAQLAAEEKREEALRAEVRAQVAEVAP